MRWLAQTLEARYPGVEFLVQDRLVWRFPEGSGISMPSGPPDTMSGLILRAGRPSMWSRVRDGAGTAFILAPLSSDALSRLVPGLGNVTLLSERASGPEPQPAPAGWARFAECRRRQAGSTWK